MSGPSKVIVLDPDPRAGRQVLLGFEREGMEAEAPALPSDPADLQLPADAGLIMVGGGNGKGLLLVRRARELLAAANADVPIMVTGRSIERGELEAAGADEVVIGPVYLRDVVTLGRILRGVPADKRHKLVGNLVETTGVYTLVRAFCALGRSAVLTLIRGLRRGEVRFYHGEVTSAQVGLIHGQAALHQLLLWTDARFDFTHEDVVRRQQIPLTPEELFADAERFLEGVRESAGSLSPATVLEPDVTRVQELGKQIPTEVHGVLRMFDGHRVLADILEDSPYRVFETLRVAQKAVEAGLLKFVDSQRPKASWKAVLAIEEWLVGRETREAVVERTATIESSPVPSEKKKGKGKRRTKKPSEPAHERQAGIDWGALVPRTIGAEVGPLSQVVPSVAAHGELELKSRDVQREKLESLMDTGKRERIFATDIGMEPKIIVDGAAVDEPKAEVARTKRKKRDDDTPVATISTDSARAKRSRRTPPAGIPETADTPVAGVPILAEAPKRTRRTPAVPVVSDSTGAAKRSRRTPVPGDGAGPPPSILGEGVPPLDDAGKNSRRTPAAGVAAIRDESSKADAAIAKARADADEDADDERLWADAERRARERGVAEDERERVEIVAQAKVDADAVAAIDSDAKAKADAEAALAQAKITADADAAAQATAETERAEQAAAAAQATARAEAQRVQAEERAAATIAALAARARAEAETKAETRRVEAQARAKSATAALRAIVEAEAKAQAERAQADAKAKAEAEATAKADADAKAVAERVAAERASALRIQAELEATRGSAAGDARAYAARVKAAAEAKRAEATAQQRGTTDPNEHVSLEAPKRPSLDAEGLVRQLIADVIPPTIGARRTPPSGIPAPEAASSSGAITAAVAREDLDAATTRFERPDIDSIREHVADPITVAEAPASTVQVTDVVTVKSTASADTASITASPRVTITGSAVVQAGHATPLLQPPGGTPIATEDDPSDGIIRSSTGETESDRLARLRRVRPPNPPEHDGPPIKETTGEIKQSEQQRAMADPRASEPSILIADQPASLARDLASVHAKASAAILAKPTIPTVDAASSSKELEVSGVRKDAVAFTDDEEDFFKRAESHTHSVPKIESFADLDEGYVPPPTFWERVFGKKKT